MNPRRRKAGLYAAAPDVAMITAMIAATALAGCRGGDVRPMNTLAPKSDLARWMLGLLMEVGMWDALIFTIVVVAFILAVFVFSTRVGEAGPPSRVSSDLGLEVAWTLGPALVLLFIAIPTVRLIFRTQPRTPQKDELVVNVVAHQWWWEFHYADGSNVAAANELHIPLDRPIRLELESADIIHSFWVPELGGKRDVVPGQKNQISLVANVAGEFYGQCAEFCGLSHANMRFRVFADAPDDFAMWEKNQQAPGATPARGTAAAMGAQIYANSPCTACHTIGGVSKGYIGPDLTHLASRTTIAAGVLKNDRNALSRWIADPEAVKPGAEMPGLAVSGEQLNDLLAYLESLK